MQNLLNSKPPEIVLPMPLISIDQSISTYAVPLRTPTQRNPNPGQVKKVVLRFDVKQLLAASYLYALHYSSKILIASPIHVPGLSCGCVS